MTADEPLVDDRFMRWEEIDRCSQAWLAASGAPGSPFDEFRGKFLPLPDWWDASVDPFSDIYVAQMDRLWGDMVGETGAYDPLVHEITADTHVDAVYRPGIFTGGRLEHAGEMFITTGHILQHAGLTPASRVIEFGAGWAMNAVNIARFGCEVHTVDIDETFCSAVRAQAEHLRLNLTAHQREFGFNPGGRFDLILFEACFHHARDWRTLIPRLRDMLAPGGKIMLASEPIYLPAHHGPDPLWMPYPWGLRLEAEVAAITRIRKWYELGFRQDFLADVFAREGFSYVYRPGLLTAYADIHEFMMV